MKQSPLNTQFNPSPLTETTLQLLQSTMLGKLYRRHFRRHPLVRAIVLWTWKRLSPVGLLVYSKIIFKFNHVPLIKLSQHSSDRRVIFLSQSVVTPKPDIFPKEKERNIPQPHSEYEFPAISITTIKNCAVTGASNFLDVDNHIICHDLFNFSHDYTSEELHGCFVINTKKLLITRLSSSGAKREIQHGVVFTDAISHNYAHFLTEVLPRIFLFSQEYPNNRASLIIDAALHPNLVGAIRLVVGEEVGLIALERGEQLLVNSLQVMSPCGYIPFERRPGSNALRDHSHGIFSPVALRSLRDYIKSKSPNLTQILKPKHSKLFIRRNSGYRNVSNAEEIEGMLVAKGFLVVEPEKLNFLEQFELFFTAKVVVGATGAALSNLIFCNSSAKIIILISDYKYMPYWYWQNMACASDNRVAYVLGECIDEFAHLHSNYKINPSDVLNAIDQ